MRVTNAGKFVLFLLAVGLAAGAWQLYRRFMPQGANIPLLGGPPTPAPQKTASGGFDQPNDSATPPSGAGTTGGAEILLVTSPTKRDWLGEQIEKFNAANAGRFQIRPRFIETREAMQAILNGREKPVLWSPSSPVWAARLGEAYAEKTNERILDVADSATFRIFLRTPIVFLTTQGKAEALRPLLGGRDAWKNVAALGAGRKRVPFGKFRYAHADPITANSGFLTVSLMLLDYVQSKGGSVAPEQAATSAGFLQYLRAVEKSLVFDQPAREGSSALTRAFKDDPQRYDAITTYESSALDALKDNPNLAVIYPEPTLMSEQSVAVLSGSWVTPEQREGAEQFLTFLASRESLEGGIRAHFRPAQGGGALSLGAELTRNQQRGFRQSITTVELPGYQAMNDAAYQWRQNIAKNVTP